MRPLTDHLPKPLLAVGGKPLIVWHIERLARCGILDIVVNHAWLGEKIEAALGDGSAFGVHIAYSAEGEPLETAGGIARAMPLLIAPVDDAPFAADQPFLVISGDTFCDFDFGRARTIALQMRHAALACWCIMVTNPAHHPDGDFTLADGRLAERSSADPPTPRLTTPRLTYSGIGLYTPAGFPMVVHPCNPLRAGDLGYRVRFPGGSHIMGAGMP